MHQYIMELSKYGITGCMVLYTLVSFCGLFVHERIKQGLYIGQCALMFLIQLLCFLDLAVVSGDMQYVFFYVFVQVFLLAAAVMVPMIYVEVNRTLLGGLCMLSGIGLCVISRLSFDRAVRQYIIVLISLIIALLLPYLLSQVRFLKKITWVYGLLGVAMLGAVLVLSQVTYGSKITFTLGQITFQPSEFVKILFIFFLAGLFWENATFGKVVLSAIVAGMHVIILVLSRDLGSALIFFVAYVFIVFVATRNYIYLLLGAAGGVGASYMAYQLFTHIQERVLAWKDPWSYIDNQGYSITQSLFAIGSGSWFGLGLLQGNPDDIPKVMEDFIFSSICEELGVIFGICVILVTVCMFLMMLKISSQIHDRFYQLIVYGISIMYIFQIFLTIGGGTKLIPLTGVTLPFISYGGSSVMTTMIMFFLVQGIYIRLQQVGGKRNGNGTEPGKRNRNRTEPGKRNGNRTEPGKRESATKSGKAGEEA